MAFYNPMQAGPDWGGGISELLNMFLMYKMVQQMYPDGKKKGDKETYKGMPKIGEMFLGETPVPPGRDIPQPQTGQPDIQQIMQMLGGIMG